MIPSEFGFSATPVYTAVQPQANDFDASARSDSRHSHHRSTSFSHILASLSKADESGSSRSGQTQKQTGNDAAQPARDGSAAGEGVQSGVQPLPFTISGLLALLTGQHTSIKDGSVEGSAPADNETQLKSSKQITGQPNASQANAAQADSGSRAGSRRALALRLMPVLGAAKGQGKRTEEKTSSRQEAARGAAAGIAVPIEMQQAATETLENGAACDTGSETSSPGSANGNAPAQTANSQSAAGASGAAVNAPLAFAMLLSTGGASAGANLTAAGSADLSASTAMGSQHGVAGLMSTAVIQSAPILATAHEGNAEANVGLAVAAESGTSGTSDDRTPAAEQPRSTNASDADPNADTRIEVVRNVRVQLQADNNQRVDIRLVDEGGGLRVSVRSADASLAQALQDRMPELTNRLEQQHVRAEVWIPRSPESAGADASNARNFSWQGGGSSGERNSGRRQNGHQNNQPDWLDEDISRQSGVKGKANQIWVQ